MPKHDDVDNLYRQALLELENARTELADAQKRTADSGTRVRLLEGLLALDPNRRFDTTIDAGSLATNEDALDATVEILKERGTAMGIRELRAELLARNVPLPGRGDDANLIGKYQRSGGRVIRVARGLYDIPRDVRDTALVFADGRVVKLGDKTRIGRGDECEIVLADPKVSRIHATVMLSASGPMIVDSGSANGTYINGHRVNGTSQLSSGDRVQLGDTVFTFSAS
ncbi:MAG TPA: FHA domain-containing protein [Coriobacteriia bacterium]